MLVQAPAINFKMENVHILGTVFFHADAEDAWSTKRLSSRDKNWRMQSDVVQLLVQVAVTMGYECSHWCIILGCSLA